DRARMSKLARDAVDGRDDVALRLVLRIEGRGLAQCACGKDCSGPGTEILGREVFAGDFADVLVHIIRGDSAALPLGVDVLKELLARELLAAFDHARHATIRDPHGDFAPALALEEKTHGRPPDVDVAAAQRGQAEGVILPRVLLVADAQIRGLQQPDDRRRHLLFRQAFAAQVACDPPADPWHGPGEAGQAVELVRVTHLPPSRVITVLLAAARVTAGGLEMASRARRDPHLLPGRRDGQGLDPVECGGVADALAVGTGVFELLPLADAPYARLVVRGVDQPGLGCGV